MISYAHQLLALSNAFLYRDLGNEMKYIFMIFLGMTIYSGASQSNEVKDEIVTFVCKSKQFEIFHIKAALSDKDMYYNLCMNNKAEMAEYMIL